MKQAVLKNALNVIGIIAVALGILGIFLPLLPTTPFLLLASACFARGSERLHRWLLGNKLLGTAIRDFEQGKGMPRKAKIMALVLLWVSLAFSMFQVRSMPLVALLATVGAGVTAYLLLFVPTKVGADR
ncbi:MAG: YbaN family protein [Pseudomonadota bacterium]